MLPNVQQVTVLKYEEVTGRTCWSESCYKSALDALGTLFQNEVLEVQTDWDPAADLEFEPDKTAGPSPGAIDTLPQDVVTARKTSRWNRVKAKFAKWRRRLQTL